MVFPKTLSCLKTGLISLYERERMTNLFTPFTIFILSTSLLHKEGKREELVP
jgi:hypothetical protein